VRQASVRQIRDTRGGAGHSTPHESLRPCPEPRLYVVDGEKSPPVLLILNQVRLKNRGRGPGMRPSQL
jgi:hypothetical protein